MLKLDEEGPCPCGQPGPARSCHLKLFHGVQRDGEGRIINAGPQRVFEIAQADTRPARPKTGYAHPKCYAGALNDCGDKITREHYLSAVVLERLAGASGTVLVRYDGLPQKELSVASIVIRRLCDRHNNVLSPLDDCAGRVFDAVCDVGTHLESGHNLIVGVNGHDFERWLLKLICGYLVVLGKPIPPSWIPILFGVHSILLPRGLYIQVANDQVMAGSQIRTQLLYHADDGPVACRVQLMNYEFILSMKERPPGLSEDAGKWSLPRPHGFEMVYPSTGARFVLVFSWQSQAGWSSFGGTWQPNPTG